MTHRRRRPTNAARRLHATKLAWPEPASGTEHAAS